MGWPIPACNVLVPKLVCAKTSFSEIWALPYDCVRYVFRRYHIYGEASRLVVDRQTIFVLGISPKQYSGQVVMDLFA